MDWDYRNQPPLNDPVDVVDYDPGWGEVFQRERMRVSATLGRVAVGIEHVGSTAVPGLAAKPVLDILVGAHPFPLCEDKFACLGALGYEYRGARGLGLGQFFRTNPRNRHLRVVTFDGEEWRTCLLFRDYLRAHSGIAEDYAALKRELARQHRYDRGRYGDGKDAFIMAILRQAAAELGTIQSPPSLGSAHRCS